MNIRSWKYEDILKISEMEKECFPKEPWSYQALVSSFSNNTFYGVACEDGDEIVGYGGITIAADSADIDNIGVGESYRRGGVGSAIIEALCEEAKKREVKKIFLEVRVSNVPAMCLYLKMGFRGLYARLRYYNDGEDALVMVKEI